MNNSPLVVKPTPELVERMSANLREADKNEVKASHNLNPLDAVSKSIEADPHACRCALSPDGEPFVMWGVNPTTVLAPTALPWALGTELTRKYATWFLRESKNQVERMNDLYPILLNWVDARHEVTLRWVKRLGFSVAQPEPFGYENKPFCLITRGI